MRTISNKLKNNLPQEKKGKEINNMKTITFLKQK